eukprot:945741-Amorphochlora_amoeboformis.AAC.1
MTERRPTRKRRPLALTASRSTTMRATAPVESVGRVTARRWQKAKMWVNHVIAIWGELEGLGWVVVWLCVW